jgi:hypothetical protein
MEGSNWGLPIHSNYASHRDPWLLTNSNRNLETHYQNYEKISAHNDLKRKSAEVKTLRKATDINQIKVRENEKILRDLKDTLEAKQEIVVKKQRIMEKIDITNQNLIQTLNTLELNSDIIDRIITSHVATSKENGHNFFKSDEDDYRQNLKMKEILINLTKDHYRAIDGIRHMGTGIEELRLSLQGTDYRNY